MGSAVSSIADTVGSAVGDIANFAGDVITNPVVDTAAAIALGQPELAADTFGASTAADIAANQAASDLAASTLASQPASDLVFNFMPTDTSPITTSPISYSDVSNISNLLSPDNTGETGNQSGDTSGTYDPNTGIFTPTPIFNPTPTSQNTGEIGNQTGSTGTYDPSTGIFTPTSTNTGGIMDIIKNIPQYGIDTVKNLLKGLTPADYLKGAGIGGLTYLAYANQQDINNAILNRYNQMQANKALKLAQYQTPGATPSLNLGTVTPRTAQNVVVMPRSLAKDGGVMKTKHSKDMQDLMSEYEHLKLRRKNYAKGNVVTPFKMVNPFRGIPINVRNPMYLTPMERRNEEIKSMGTARSGFADGTSQSGITATSQANDKRTALINMLKSNPALLKKLLQQRAMANQPQMQLPEQQEELGAGISQALGFKKGGIPEIDYRDKGGYVPPIGKKERADDIPAMLSNNEFVFTAKAVRNAGKGNVKEGAKKMYALMKHLEGKV